MKHEEINKREAAKTEYKRTVIGTKACTGAAHSNAHIDNCMECAPRWGIVDDYAPIDFDAARSAGKVILFGHMTDDEYDQADKLITAGQAEIVSRTVVNGRGKLLTNYNVLRFL